MALLADGIALWATICGCLGIAAADLCVLPSVMHPGTRFMLIRHRQSGRIWVLCLQRLFWEMVSALGIALSREFACFKPTDVQFGTGQALIASLALGVNIVKRCFIAGHGHSPDYMATILSQSSRSSRFTIHSLTARLITTSCVSVIHVIADALTLCSCHRWPCSLAATLGCGLGYDPAMVFVARL